jgi:hypothetical protein
MFLCYCLEVHVSTVVHNEVPSFQMQYAYVDVFYNSTVRNVVKPLELYASETRYWGNSLRKSTATRLPSTTNSTVHVLPGDRTTLRSRKTRLNFKSIDGIFTKCGILVIRILGHLRHLALHLHPYLRSGLRPKGRPRYLSQDLRSARLTTRCAMISLPERSPRQSSKQNGQQRMPDQLLGRKLARSVSPFP